MNTFVVKWHQAIIKIHQVKTKGSMDRPNMPSKKKIIDYWVDGEGSVLLEEKGIELASYGNNNYDCCFACGDILRRVEKAHILAHRKCGSATVDNLHLLCRECHLESEYLDGDIYWIWLENMNKHHFKLPGEWSLERALKRGFDLEYMCTMLLENKLDEAHAHMAQTTGFKNIPRSFIEYLQSKIS